MFCQNCGKKNVDGAKFCTGCGNQIIVVDDTVQRTRQTQQFTQVPKQERPTDLRSQVTEKRMRAENFAQQFRSQWRKMVKSPLVLALLVLFTLQAFLEVAYLENTVAFFEDLLMLADIDTSVLQMIPFLYMIPALLLTIGLWMQYTEAFNSNDCQIRTTGFSVIRGGLVVQLIERYILIVVALVLLVSVHNELNMYYAATGQLEEAKAELGKTVTTLIVYGIVQGVIYNFAFRAISHAQGSANSGYPESGCAGALGIIEFIAGGLLVISALSGEDEAGIYEMVSLAMPFLFGAVLLLFKNVMDKLSLEHAEVFYEESATSACSENKTQAVCQAQQSIPTWKRIEMERAAQQERE